ncbi:MAG: glycosyltransferase [Pseudomonadota bacterium]|nr:glycosyltransferase [Pseudomonadota bacterium]MDQ3160705.1 glycosyltransferase [Pseudomonadota bacterium]
MPDLISIAVPIYNTARFLPAALDSLLAQDYPHWEGLLWDDNSSDGSGEIARQYARRDPRFRLLGNGRNNGNPYALATSLATAQGGFVGVLDGDDRLEPDALSAMLRFMQDNPAMGMAYSQHVEIDEADNLLNVGTRCLTPYSPQALLLNFMTYHLRLIRANAYRAVGGYDASVDESADYDLCLRLSEHCEIGHLPQPLYRYRVRTGSVSQGSRLRQVRVTFGIAQRALQRRGLASHYALSLGMRARHVLRPKVEAES